MAIAIYPGSFDPVTFGHLDIIHEVIVGVLNNSAKSPLFSAEERVNILKKVTEDIPNLKIKSFSGLSVNFAKECNAKVIVRGLRAITDFEYELQLAQTNRILDKDIDTMFLTTSLEYAYLSSSTVKEAASFGADISEFLPPYAVEKVKEKFQGIK